MPYTIRVTRAQLLGDRENQEDAIGLSSPADFDTKGLLALLSDGMGGMERGEVYSGTPTCAENTESARGPSESIDDYLNRVTATPNPTPPTVTCIVPPGNLPR